VTDYRTATRELQNEVLNVVTKSQTAVVDVIQTWASAIQAITPDLPGLSLPYADKLPRPEEFIATGYDFAEQLLVLGGPAVQQQHGVTVGGGLDGRGQVLG